VDGLGEPSESSAFDAIMDSAYAGDEYAPGKLGQRDLLQAVGPDIRLLRKDKNIDALLLSRLWGSQRPPRWNDSIWRVAAFQLIATKEDWEPWVNWYSGILNGTHGDRLDVASVFYAAEITESEWSNPAVANAKLVRALARTERSTWAQALDDSAETDAPPITIAGSQLQFSQSIEASDATVALRSGMDVEYSNVRRHLRTLKSLAAQWINNDSHPDWHGLKKDIARLDRLMPVDMKVAVSQIAVLWAAGVAVADYLDQDRQLRSDPNSGNAPSLPANLRASLSTFVQIFAGWLLEFPTAAKREENAGFFKDALERLHLAKRVVFHIRSSNALRAEDLRLLEELLRSAHGQGPQAAKAKFFSLATVRRILFAAGRILATSAAGTVLGNYTESSILLQRLTKLMLQGEGAVVDFIQDLPAASREALLNVIEFLKNNPQQPG
jgi:hypothetical protein